MHLNPKTIVNQIKWGKESVFNDRFLAMMNYFLIELLPVHLLQGKKCKSSDKSKPYANIFKGGTAIIFFTISWS
ncbi:hypothetical protein C3007_00140 [Avibacterium gallinarum]|nr:hypothetical protein C3007_00140 [Avibacterium gallinarum]